VEGGEEISMDTCGCKTSSDVACKISVFNTEQKTHYDQLRKELTENLSVEELPCGYTFLYPNNASFLLKIAEWISYENLCCPFIRFSLHVSGEEDKIRLDLKGSEQVKSLLKQEFQLS
jgi:hypothetical protein